MLFKSHNILVVDDEKSILFSLKAALQKEGYAVRTAENPQEALKAIEPGSFQVIISDYNMPSINGLEFLKRVKQIDPEVVFILMTAFGSEKLAIEAMKEGAYDYFSKPFDIDEMRVIVAKACERFSLAWEKKNLEERFLGEPETDRIIGNSPPMQLVRERIEQVAKSDMTVLIQGESGTGKELVAEAIQRRGPRASGPFVKLNCAALPENLIESELFGYERGAFTGATGRKRGKFEVAHGGTIFLDEIGDMALNTQAKVLRAIQQKEVERLGGNEPIKVDVRIIAATHRDLRELIDKKEFREDLFYRVNVVNVTIPPLRDRVDDIPLLVEHFVKVASQKLGRPLDGVAPRAMTALKNFKWPGNVRQLQNILEGAAVFAKGSLIDLANLPEEIQLGFAPAGTTAGIDWIAEEIEKGKSLDAVVGMIEKEMIMRTLAATEGNQSQAATRLGIKRGTLQYKMKLYEIG
ncbi:MAG: sigma-54-dependent Fis family transcriptional regulator [Candidatus Riflebacteria bacterium]|nr:sigma-54-dependent Fis family transcriptional regulator [Candidatus Riflebacteria bacterium]